MPRHLAIGDIHGCLNALQTLVEFARITDDDMVITLGDYVNRGSNSCAVLDWLIHRRNKGQLVAVRGNHDIMMLESRDGDDSLRKWIGVGGKATLDSYAPFDGAAGALADIPEHHWQFLEKDLVAVYETERHFFVHANAYPDLPLEEQPDFMLYWEQFNDPPRHECGKIMVCGHTSQRSGLPLANDHAVCIDTNACRGGWLTCLHVESGLLWQANEDGETRQMFLDELSED